MDNTVKIEMPEDEFKTLLDSGLMEPEYLKEVKIDDAFLKDDPVYQALKKTSRKAYADMVTYRFEKLNNIQKKS